MSHVFFHPKQAVITFYSCHIILHNSTFELHTEPYKRVFHRVAINTILDLSVSKTEWRLE